MRERQRTPRSDSFSQQRPPQKQRARRRSKNARRRHRTTTGILRLLPIFAAVVAAGVFLSWTDGGRATRLADPLSLQLDRLAEGMGLGLNEITIGGHRRTAQRDIFAAMKLDDVRSFVLFDSKATRQRIESLPWIDRAEIRRSFPWRIEVQVSERTPFALWRHQGTDIIIDRSGRHLEIVEFGRVRSLPLVAGKGAEAVAHEIIDAVARWPDLLLATSIAKRIAQRRWDLVLSESRRIQLPARDFTDALAQLMAGSRGSRLFDKAFVEADLRLPGQVALRQRHWNGDRYGPLRPVLSRTAPPAKTRNRS